MRLSKRSQTGGYICASMNLKKFYVFICIIYGNISVILTVGQTELLRVRHEVGASPKPQTLHATGLQPRCLVDEYGPNCTHCISQNTCEHGHYTCDTDTGEKLCLPGWKGITCTEKYVPNDSYLNLTCPENNCRNKGVCVSGTCCCQPGFTGVLCQIEIIECQSQPCKNGGLCRDLVGGYKCSCPSSYSGNNCEIHSYKPAAALIQQPSCDNTTCNNGGTCYQDANNTYCVCQIWFTGRRCQTPLNQTGVLQDKDCPTDLYGKSCSTVCVPQNSCLSGHYICSPYDGTKVCLVGWMGANCDYRRIPHNLDNICPLNLTCKNGGQCYDGRCCCKGGYSGEFCHIESIGCLSSPCQNGAKCISEGRLAKGYTCKCSLGFHGDYCEVKSTHITHTTIYTGTAYTRTTYTPITRITIYTGTAYTSTTVTKFSKETPFMQSNSHKASISYFDASKDQIYSSPSLGIQTSTLPVTVLGVPSLEMAYQSSSFYAQGAKDYSIHKQVIETSKPKTDNSLPAAASSHKNLQNHTVKAYVTLYSTKINELVKTKTEVPSQDSSKTPNVPYYITPSASIPLQYSSYIGYKTVNIASSNDITLMASSGFFDTREQSTYGKFETKQTEPLLTTTLNVMPFTNISMQHTTDTKSSKTLVTVKQSFNIRDTTRNHTEFLYVSKSQSSNVTFISVFPSIGRNTSIVMLDSKINGNTVSTRLFSNTYTTLSMYGTSFKQSSAMPYFATHSSISAQKTSNYSTRFVAATRDIIESSKFWNPYATTPTETKSYYIIHGNLKPKQTVSSYSIQVMDASVISKATSYTYRTGENSPLLRTTAYVQSKNLSMDNTTVLNSAISKNPASDWWLIIVCIVVGVILLSALAVISVVIFIRLRSSKSRSLKRSPAEIQSFEKEHFSLEPDFENTKYGINEPYMLDDTSKSDIYVVNR